MNPRGIDPFASSSTSISSSSSFSSSSSTFFFHSHVACHASPSMTMGKKKKGIKRKGKESKKKKKEKKRKERKKENARTKFWRCDSNLFWGAFARQRYFLNPNILYLSFCCFQFIDFRRAVKRRVHTRTHGYKKRKR